MYASKPSKNSTKRTGPTISSSGGLYDQLAIYLGQHNDAAIDELHSTVVGKFRRILGYGHRNIINAILEHGQLLHGEKRYEQAEALDRSLVDEKLNEAAAILVRAVAGFRTQSGDRDVRTLTAAFNLGGVYQDRGKRSRAISMYHGAAYGFKDVMGISDKTTIAAFTQFAALCSARRALPEAEEAYKLALRGLQEAARQSSMCALILKLDLGVCQGLKKARSGHAPVALACSGIVYARQGRAAEAEMTFSDAVKEFAA
ncbi:TPR repeat protein [Cordyceps fumosorosea ARSEF 2679]|uniref:TPR repeat protein n=1 Tax=Cordyceps fumosorosea (strain ARSEF 2679) TaxID=1081104 RepID=A0A167JGP4_CORFA|nr:TPR repeat protein [Cordyceps fumosorosea ARSEF 2679]OAA50241.1 TPR repeat protein [Cordyceps fumosorosea ARSEF 2679]